jgi:hypothetical protein
VAIPCDQKKYFRASPATILPLGPLAKAGMLVVAATPTFWPLGPPSGATLSLQGLGLLWQGRALPDLRGRQARARGSCAETRGSWVPCSWCCSCFRRSFNNQDATVPHEGQERACLPRCGACLRRALAPCVTPTVPDLTQSLPCPTRPLHLARAHGTKRSQR